MRRGDEVLTESSGSGEGMLADLCRAWEYAGTVAADAGARVVVARSGVVLGQGGGMLLPQLPLFRLGLGARLGSRTAVDVLDLASRRGPGPPLSRRAP